MQAFTEQLRRVKGPLLMTFKILGELHAPVKIIITAKPTTPLKVARRLIDQLGLHRATVKMPIPSKSPTPDPGAF
jgi:hypothetical protein